MQSILDAIDRGEIDGRVAVVISSNDRAYALQRAAAAEIPAFVYAKAAYGSGEERDRAMLCKLQEYGVDYILLAGYLGIVSPCIVQAYPNKIVNIHPALLPKFGGKNYHGLHVHQAVLAAKEPISGATVHFVDCGTDTGPIIAQQSLPVAADDTPESLQQRILETIEHKLFVRVVRDLCADRIRVEQGRVLYDGKPVENT